MNHTVRIIVSSRDRSCSVDADGFGVTDAWDIECSQRSAGVPYEAVRQNRILVVSRNRSCCVDTGGNGVATSDWIERSDGSSISSFLGGKYAQC